MSFIVHNLSCEQCLTGDAIREDSRSGYSVCTRCGLVVCASQVLVDEEWRNFEDDDEDPSRVGAVETEATGGLCSTVIGKVSNQSKSNQAIPLVHHTLVETRERSLARANQRIEEMSSHLGLAPVIVRCAKDYFARATEVKKDANKDPKQAAKPVVRAIDSAFAAAIFWSCRHLSVSRTLKEISAVSGLKSREISRAFARLHRATASDRKIKHTSTDSDPSNLVARFISQLSLPPSLVGPTRDLLNKAKESCVGTGRRPSSLAGGAIHLIATRGGLKVACDDVAKVVDMKESTIRQVSKLFSASNL